MVIASPRIYTTDKFQGMQLAVTLLRLYYWGKIGEGVDSKAKFLFYSNYPQYAPISTLSPTTDPRTLTCSFSSTKTGLALHFARISPTHRLEDPSGHAPSPPKASALHVSPRPFPYSLQFLHPLSAPASPEEHSHHLLPVPWQHCAPSGPRRRQEYRRRPAGPVTIHLLTGPGRHRTGRERAGSPPQVTTPLGCLGFFLSCWFSFKLCSSPACCLNWSKANVSFFTRLPKRDHSWKEDGRKKQRLHGIFLTRLLHLHLSTTVLEPTELPLVFQVVPNSQPFASGAWGLSEGALSCEVSKAPWAIAACPQEPFVQGSSLPGPFGGGAMVWRVCAGSSAPRARAFLTVQWLHFCRARSTAKRRAEWVIGTISQIIHGSYMWV